MVRSHGGGGPENMVQTILLTDIMISAATTRHAPSGYPHQLPGA